MIKSKANANSDDTDDISNDDNTDDISNEAVAGPEEESFIFYSDGLLNDSTIEDKSVDNPDKFLLLTDKVWRIKILMNIILILLFRLMRMKILMNIMTKFHLIFVHMIDSRFVH